MATFFDALTWLIRKCLANILIPLGLAAVRRNSLVFARPYGGESSASPQS